MLLVNQIKLRPGYGEEELKKKLASAMHIFEDEIIDFKVEKLSVDARKKPDIFFILSVSCNVKHEKAVLKRITNGSVTVFEPVKYTFEITGNRKLKNRPVVVGAGPAGLFCAYYLALAGYAPIVFERGYDIDSRTKDVAKFWETGKLNPNSNVQFGEGGAGAFSDGKLNTLVKDKCGRNRAVLELFVKNGASEDILIESKPHIGTDVLVNVVRNMREEIKSMGGEFRFNAEVTDIEIKDGKVFGITVNGLIKVESEAVVLAIGHSARNTFEMLCEKGISMHQKEFAVGLRVEHPQSMINSAMYGPDESIWEDLPVAPYKLTHQSSLGRGVYSFCMCPGGYVVNASSEPNRTCVNGMSYKDRGGKHANSAIIVTVTSKDFKDDHPLAGVRFQRTLEEKAYSLGKGKIPVEFYGDFKREVETGLTDMTDIAPETILSNQPECKGAFCFAPVSEILPDEINRAFVEGMEAFGSVIPGFNNEDAILSGVESRTSSPVRITRNEVFESENTVGLYPCGEGAGYAGGIMSAAMDGMKVFEAIIGTYCI
ncbi:MAG: FAD-dependent oxidoreductase [Lachnospiraceae bacterium]|nr:FAD-dependent oxidoreductase [Lachnospiraceae bacterium]